MPLSQGINSPEGDIVSSALFLYPVILGIPLQESIDCVQILLVL